MVRDILLTAQEGSLELNIRKTPKGLLYVCECFLQCGNERKRLGITKLSDFVEDFDKAFSVKRDIFVTVFGSTCAVSMQYRDDHIVFKYVDADNKPIGSSILYKSNQEKWLKILKELDSLLKEEQQA